MNIKSNIVRKIGGKIFRPLNEIRRAMEASNWIEEDAIALIENNKVPTEQELKDRYFA